MKQEKHTEKPQKEEAKIYRRSQKNKSYRKLTKHRKNKSYKNKRQ